MLWRTWCTAWGEGLPTPCSRDGAARAIAALSDDNDEHPVTGVCRAVVTVESFADWVTGPGAVR